MARGWESKSVESQMDDARAGSVEKRDRGSDEQRRRAQKRAGLETSRNRIVRELETARSATHRAALENALAFLDGELRKLDAG